MQHMVVSTARPQGCFTWPIALSRLQVQSRGAQEEGEGEVVECFQGAAEDTVSGEQGTRVNYGKPEHVATSLGDTFLQHGVSSLIASLKQSLQGAVAGPSFIPSPGHM